MKQLAKKKFKRKFGQNVNKINDIYLYSNLKDATNSISKPKVFKTIYQVAAAAAAAARMQREKKSGSLVDSANHRHNETTSNSD